ncbi:unnamed protein product [Didymodactylos carnosus]|nr:unnamed protein product [Didymodactylos carnosus]CAF4474112.1 unnamed protein product [Didymodactylos carnosus]
MERDGGCIITGSKNHLTCAHLLPRDLFIKTGVLDIDTPENAFMVDNGLEKKFDDNCWTFNEDGVIEILCKHFVGVDDLLKKVDRIDLNASFRDS